MAVSVYDEQFLTQEQQERLRRLGEAWQRARAAGDSAEMDRLKAEGEGIRASAGYHGGADGTEFLPFDVGGYTSRKLPSYQPQTEAVDRLYDAALEKRLSELQNAYRESRAALRDEKADIPKVYGDKRNSEAAASELAARSFNEYAAASGLSSGGAGQAALAMSNQLQSDLSALTAGEAAAITDVGRREAELRTKYAGDVASAIAQGELDRARELLEEYRAAGQSAVTTAREQADEDYRSWQSAQARRQSRIDAENEEWQRRLKEAQLRAQYGDLSGLRELGVKTAW